MLATSPIALTKRSLEANLMASETLPVHKTCTKCRVSKPSTNEFFSKARRGLRSQCKDCVNAEERVRREKNPGEARARGMAWYAANKERKNRASADWYARNKVEVSNRRLDRISADKEAERKRTREWARNRYRRDPRHRICSCVSSHIRKCLKGGKRGRSWQSLVGYSIDELASHLERQFLAGMSWDNYGEWHIDHIRPISSFKFSSTEDADFRACWALSNLRPLWGIENLRKVSKVVSLF